jgi:hypothetical protein
MDENAIPIGFDFTTFTLSSAYFSRFQRTITPSSPAVAKRQYRLDRAAHANSSCD